MTKSELIKRLLAKRSNLLHKDVTQIVDIVLEEITVALMHGKRVELRGFGAFSVRQRPPRKARNPKTNAVVSLPSRSTPYFRAGKDLRERVNKKVA